MKRRNVWLLFFMALALLLVAACQPKEVVKTVVVTKEVKEEVVVTKEVEVVKTVEVTPAKGACAPQSFDELPKDKDGNPVIKIGVPIPLSAPGSVTGGQAMQIAANIAVDHINAEGGILGKYKVDVVFYDTSGLPERGRAGAEYLITQECVVAIAGEYHSAAGVQEKEVAHEYCQVLQRHGRDLGGHRGGEHRLRCACFRGDQGASGQVRY